MNTLKKIVWGAFLLLLTAGGLTACKKDKAPEMTQVELEEGLKSTLTKNKYDFDQLENIKAKEAELSEKDKTKLSSLFEVKVPVIKLDLNFRIVTALSNSEVKFSIVYAYYDNAWTAVFGYPTDEEAWVTDAKDKVGKRIVMEDLRKMNFKGFEKGYVGKENNTKVIIRDRETKMSINRDTLYTDVVVRTDFAKYKIEVDLVYEFKDDEWTLSKSKIQDQKLWAIDFDEEDLPNELSSDAIIKKLTNKENFLTYVTNPDYVSNTVLSEKRQVIGVDMVSFVFDWITEYDNIGSLTYRVTVPYTFSEGEWTEGEIKVALDNVDIEAMIGKWVSEDGDYIMIEKALKSRETERRNILVANYFLLDEEGEPLRQEEDPFAKKEDLEEESEEDEESMADADDEDLEDIFEEENNEDESEATEEKATEEETTEEETTEEVEEEETSEEESSYFTYELKANLLVSKKDNGWKFKVRNFEPKSKGGAKMTIDKMKLDLSSKALIINDKVFHKDGSNVEPEAVKSDDEIIIDSIKVAIPAYVIEGENYFKLRDLAYALRETKVKFDLGYSPEEKLISIKTGGDYTPIDGDMEPIKNERSVGIRSYDKLMVDDEITDAKAYRIEGLNYYRLRDIANALGFTADYNFDKNTVKINSDASQEEIDRQREKEFDEDGEEEIEDEKSKDLDEDLDEEEEKKSKKDKKSKKNKKKKDKEESEATKVDEDDEGDNF